MKNFCIDLKEHATKVCKTMQNYAKKEMIPLTRKENP